MLSVLLYRLAVAGAIYALVNGFPLGPTVGDIIVAVTGACIQLVFILIMNKIYGFLAYQLTNWGTTAIYVFDVSSYTHSLSLSLSLSLLFLAPSIQ